MLFASVVFHFSIHSRTSAYEYRQLRNDPVTTKSLSDVIFQPVLPPLDPSDRQDIIFCYKSLRKYRCRLHLIPSQMFFFYRRANLPRVPLLASASATMRRRVSMSLTPIETRPRDSAACRRQQFRVCRVFSVTYFSQRDSEHVA